MIDPAKPGGHLIRSVDSAQAHGKISSAVGVAAAILLFAAAYFLLQRLSFALRLPPFQRTTVWTPGALLFAVLLLAPTRRWWIYYIGFCLGVFFAFYDDIAIPVATAMLAAQFCFAAVALGVWWLRRFSANLPFGSPTSLLAFVATAVLVAVATSAPIDLVRFVSGADDVAAVALRAMLCFLLGILIGTPGLALTLANGAVWFRARSWKAIAEFACPTISLLVVGYLCFDWSAALEKDQGATSAPMASRP